MDRTELATGLALMRRVLDFLELLSSDSPEAAAAWERLERNSAARPELRLGMRIDELAPADAGPLV